MLVIPAQSPGVRDRYGLTREDTDHAAWAVDPGGVRHRGAAAVNRALAELPGPWPAVAGLYEVAPLRLVEDAVYGLVARSRHWLGLLTRTPPEVG